MLVFIYGKDGESVISVYFSVSEITTVWGKYINNIYDNYSEYLFAVVYLFKLKVV
jgi:hypothetical protein